LVAQEEEEEEEEEEEAEVEVVGVLNEIATILSLER
jgi:hypothetical protein